MSEEKKDEYVAENADAEADTIFGSTPDNEPGKPKSGKSFNTKALIIGICAVVLLGGGLTAASLLMKQPEEDVTDSSSGETILLSPGNAEDVVTVDVANTDDFTVIITSEATEDKSAVYGIEGLEDMEVDTNLVSTLVNNGSKLEAQSLVEEKAADLSKYGLTDPAAEVTLHFKDGSAFSFSVGDVAPMGTAQTYCAVDGDVYLVQNSLVANYQKSSDKFISTTILTEPEQSEYPIVESVVIERQDLEYEIAMEYDHEGAEDDTVGGTASTHLLTSPVKAYLNVETSSDVVTGMFGLSAKEIAAVRPDAAELKKAGMDDPFCKVTMVCDDGNTYHLLFGNTYETEDGTTCYYTQFEDVPLLYGVTAEKAVWTTVMPGDITSANIFTTNVWNLATLDITAGDRHLSFEGEGTSGEDYVVTKDGKTVETERFRLLFQFILSIYGEELYLGDAPTGEPDAEIHLTTQNGKEDYTVSFYKQSDLKTIVMRNDACYQVRTSCLEALMHNIDIFDTDEELQMSWQ